MTAFEAWLATFRLEEPDEGGQVGALPAGGMDLFREVFARSGPVSAAELRAMWQSREVELARRAVTLIVADIRRTTDLIRTSRSAPWTSAQPGDR